MRTAEQEQFAASLHEALAAADVPGAARRWAAGDRAPGQALWRKLAGLGVTALAVPQRWGGLGASLRDVAVACEELGHHALPGPVPESVAAVPVLLATLARESGTAAQSPAPRSPAVQSLGGPITGGPVTGGPVAAGPGRRRPDRHPGAATLAALCGGRGRGRPDPAGRRRRPAARHGRRRGTGRWTRPGRCRRYAAGRCWPAVPWRPRRPPGRARRARWPVRRNCSARAGPCWRPASGRPPSAPSSASRSGHFRPSSITWPTWRSGWSSPGRCSTRRRPPSMTWPRLTRPQRGPG